MGSGREFQPLKCSGCGVRGTGPHSWLCDLEPVTKPLWSLFLPLKWDDNIACLVVGGGGEGGEAELLVPCLARPCRKPSVGKQRSLCSHGQHTKGTGWTYVQSQLCGVSVGAAGSRPGVGWAEGRSLWRPHPSRPPQEVLGWGKEGELRAEGSRMASQPCMDGSPVRCSTPLLASHRPAMCDQ